MNRSARDLLVAALLVAIGTAAIVGDFLTLNDQIAHHQAVNSTPHARPLAAREGN